MTARERCIFCGESDTGSQEHLVAEHWRGLHGRPERADYRREGYADLSATGKVSVYGKSLLDMPTFSRRTPGVCQVGCNSGWMSKLEEDVTPFITHFLAPADPNSIQFFTPSPDLRRMLRRWIAKTAIVIERAHEGEKLAQSALIKAVRTDNELVKVHSWIMEHSDTAVPPDMVSTRHMVLVTVDGLMQYRLCLFTVYEMLCVCLYGADEPSDDWLASLGPARLLGPEVQDAAVMPSTPVLPVLHMRALKGHIDESLREMSETENLRRLEQVGPEERRRLEVRLAQAHELLAAWQAELERERQAAHARKQAEEAEYRARSGGRSQKRE